MLQTKPRIISRINPVTDKPTSLSPDKKHTL